MAPPAELQELATQIGVWLANAGLTLPAALQHPRFTCASNLYRRFGDLALHGTALRHELKDPSPWRAAVLGGSLLVGYFSTAKSILDAVAITLNEVCGLALAPRQQDLSRGQFMNALQRTDPGVRARYVRFLSFVKDVVAWRDASVHRAAPLLIVHTDRERIEDASREEMRVRMAARPDVTLTTFPGVDAAHWIEPTDIPGRWEPQFLDLCREATVDLVR